MVSGKQIRSSLSSVKKFFSSARNTALAGLAGSLVLASQAGRSVRKKADELTARVKHQKHSKEVVVMKKSTLVALLVVLAAIAGALGALYVYVIRRERELDEYEQLLFSEDCDCDDDVDEYDDEPDLEPAEVPEA